MTAFKLQWGDIIDVGAFDGLTVIDYDDTHVKCDMDGYEDESGLFLIDDIDGFSRVHGRNSLQAYRNSDDDWSVYIGTLCGELECKVSANSFTECMTKFEDGEWDFVSC